jgi:hypothetical protein
MSREKRFTGDIQAMFICERDFSACGVMVHN